MTVTRRTMIGATTAAGLLAATAPAAPRRAAPPQPDAFLWGAATAAHQIEGNNVSSDYWVLENVPSTGFPDRSGDACDSWTRWREDIAMLASLGLNAYRFSVEWARIEPEPGHYSEAVLDQYRRICVACREAGITPIVTFHHFTSPRWIAALGGWENPAVIDHYVRYCVRVARALGDLLAWGCTLNEPNGQVSSYLIRDGKPFEREPVIRREAARAVGSDRFGAFFMGDALAVRDICLKAHAAAVPAIKAVAPHIRLGMTLALQDMIAGPDGEQRYRRLYDEARAPFYAAAAKDDFIGVQPYQRLIVGPKGYLPTPNATEVGRSGADASPDVLPAVVREVHRACAAPIMITENGIDTLDDAQRSRHLTQTLAGLARCRADGIAILGYIYWSLLDNFEWGSGYTPRFGLAAVDRTSFRRDFKPSAAVYRRLVAQARAASA